MTRIGWDLELKLREVQLHAEAGDFYVWFRTWRLILISPTLGPRHDTDCWWVTCYVLPYTNSLFGNTFVVSVYRPQYILLSGDIYFILSVPNVQLYSLLQRLQIMAEATSQTNFYRGCSFCHCTKGRLYRYHCFEMFKHFMVCKLHLFKLKLHRLNCERVCTLRLIMLYN